ncbi:hypothetical protein [Sporocytophaga sp.]|nr:hypothetical protein [Sporocytophaga sp.]
MPVTYSLYHPLGLSTLVSCLSYIDQTIIQDEHGEEIDLIDE